LIELLVVISIIGLLSTLAIVSLSSARAKARDAKRYSDIAVIRRALDLYYLDNNQYVEEVAVLFNFKEQKHKNFFSIPEALASDTPTPIDPEFEYSYRGNFLKDLVIGGYLQATPLDPVNSQEEGMYYFYRRYAADEHNCGVSLGPSYILGVTNLESFSATDRPNPNNQIPSCGIYTNFAGQYDYLVGDFE